MEEQELVLEPYQWELLQVAFQEYINSDGQKMMHDGQTNKNREAMRDRLNNLHARGGYVYVIKRVRDVR